MSEKCEFIIKVDESKSGTRLDVLLAKEFSSFSRTQWQENIKSGKVILNNTAIYKPSVKVKLGDEIRGILPQIFEYNIQIKPTKLDFEILYEDEHIIAVNKPAGLVVHPGAGKETNSVVSAVLSYCQLSSIGAPYRPGVIHRLDKDTSGVLLLAKTDEAHYKFQKLFAKRLVHKKYLAIVHGWPKVLYAKIEVPIERDRLLRKRMKPVPIGQGKIAISFYKVLCNLKATSLVEINTITGRTHQIRVHMSYIGHPLLGDVLYGGKKFEGKAFHFLHAYLINFIHPFTQKEMQIFASLPIEYKNTLIKLGYNQANLNIDIPILKFT